MDFQEDFRDKYKERKGVIDTYRWMGWLYTIVGCFIVALLVLMFLDMSNRSRAIEFYDQENNPGLQIPSTTPIDGPINTIQ